MPKINGATVRQMAVPLPPAPEQSLVLSALEEAAAAVETASRKVAEVCKQLEALDRAVLGKAFRGELVPQHPNDEPASVLLERIRADREGQVPASSQRIGRKRALKRQAAE